MEAKHIQLVAAGPDEKVWIAEITDDDETFKLKRDFLPEKESGIWDIYPGWYQIQGLVPGLEPFQKEYVKVEHGEMTRFLNFRWMLQELPKIKAYEPQRLERVKHQLHLELDEIKAAVPFEPVAEEIERQKEDLDFLENSSQAIASLGMLRQRKASMIKQYTEFFQDWEEQW